MDLESGMTAKQHAPARHLELVRQACDYIDGQPYFVSEYGGIWWDPNALGGEQGWGYGDRPTSERDYIDRYRALTDVLLANPHICGFSYTQLYDIEQAREDILWAEHLVVQYPTWWASTPALLKGFFDRTLVPGFAYRYRDTGRGWDKLLAGRSARLLVTMDAPAIGDEGLTCRKA